MPFRCSHHLGKLPVKPLHVVSVQVDRLHAWLAPQCPKQLRMNGARQDSPAWALFMAFEHENIHTETSSVLMRELPIECVQKPKWVSGHASAYVWACLQLSDRASSDTSHTSTLNWLPPALLREANWTVLLLQWPEYHASVTPTDMAFMCNFPSNNMIALPGGDAVVGKPLDFPSFGWDNEYGRRAFHVREFSASQFLISNGEFLEFVKDGGYRKEQYWTKHGWMWRTFRNAKKPTFWAWAGPQGKMDFKVEILPLLCFQARWVSRLHAVPIASRSSLTHPCVPLQLRLIFEEIVLPLSLPAMVNLHEAKAYCAWLSEKHGLTGQRMYRLLSEPEHHR